MYRIFTPLNTHRKDLLILLVFLLIPIIWYFPFLFTKSVGILDWQKESYFYNYLKDSINEFNEYPYSFIKIPEQINFYPTLKSSSTYIANPEVLTLSPFLVLLPFLSAVGFLKVYFIGHLLIGSIGYFILFKKLKLNSLSGLFLLLLTFLSPWLIQHLAIGYTPWITACYIPLILWCLLKSTNNRNYLIIAFILNALILFEGGAHVFNWLNGSLVLFFIVHTLINRKVNVKNALLQFLYLLGTVILILPKLLIMLQAYQGYKDQIIQSYSSISDIIGILVDVKTPLYNLPQAYNIYNTPIYDASIGVGYWFLALFVIIFLYFIYCIIRKKINRKELSIDSALIISFLIFLILGINGVWAGFASKIGLLSTEKYPYRFLYIAIIFFGIFIVRQVKNIHNKYMIMALVAIFIFLGIDTYSRVNYFDTVATSSTDIYANYSLKDNFSRISKEDVGITYKEFTPNKITFKLDQGSTNNKVLLNWLSPDYIKDFDVKNGSLERLDDKTMVSIEDKNNNVEITPKLYSLPLLIVCSLTSFFILILFLLNLDGIYKKFIKAKPLKGIVAAIVRSKFIEV